MEEKNYKNNESREQKNIWIGILVAVLAVIIIGVILGSGKKSSNNENSTTNNSVGANELKVTNVEMTIEYSDLFEGWDVTITGKAKNVSNKNYSYACVEFSIYDKNGNNLGSASANMNNLAPGETWSFEASWLEYSKDEPVSCKLSDVTTW